MYLVGDLSDTDYFDHTVKVKKEITKNDLAKCKNQYNFQVIDLKNHKYFDPESNSWVKFKSE